ncbi:hypothetical protein [Candidatus Amarolinea aalborgensis]|jgi:hypothetical protein|uniref:hypothetical protein n=1 Tax=Candidatus Amarolinea aalborgensis TaxID=2249329 RepID=UPI003BFA1211
MDVISALFEERIVWHSVEPEGEGPEYYAYIDGAKCEIRMNDFPDESLFTLRFQGQSLNIDNRPSTWVFPFDQDH